VTGTATPYYSDDTVTLYLGDCREILPALGERFDCAVADPSYEATSLRWDHWADGWPALVARYTNSLWCFGSLRMFLRHHAEIETAGWRLSHDALAAEDNPSDGDVHVVWEKHNGSSPVADRLKQVHEHAAHWYRGAWKTIHHQTPRVADPGRRHSRSGDITVRRNNPAHTGTIDSGLYVDDGTRLVRSVIHCRSANRSAIHPTEKPVELLDVLIRYACPPGGVVLDPFAGSASTAVAARLSGRRAVLIERYEPYAEKAAERLSQTVLPLEVR
jgi:site-specific DNA-methyltransferase (adenine-specific)